MHFSRQLHWRLLRCSWNIACQRCSNYIFILNLTPGLNGLGKDNYKMRQEAFKFWDLVCHIRDFKVLFCFGIFIASKLHQRHTLSIKLHWLSFLYGAMAYPQYHTKKITDETLVENYLALLEQWLPWESCDFMRCLSVHEKWRNWQTLPLINIHDFWTCPSVALPKGVILQFSQTLTSWSELICW